MKANLLNILMALFICFLMACGGAKKAVISTADISKAESNGTLEELYNKIGKTIQESSGSSKKNAIGVQSQIVQRLVATYESKVEAQLANKTEYDLVSRQSLQALASSMSPVKQWDQEAYNAISKQISFEQASTNKAIKKASKSANENNDKVNVKLNYLKKAAVLAGSDEPESKLYEKTKLEDLEQLSIDGRNAYQKRMFNIAIQKAKMGLSIDTGNIAFESLLAQADASLFEQKFNEALQNGKPEVAYNALLEIADKPIMLQVKKKMGRNILLLANYFANNAEVAYKKGDFYLAYNEFRRGRDIQVKLSAANRGFIQEKAFLDLLKKESSKNQLEFGKNFALLQVIKEFDDSYPTLSQSMSLNIDNINSRSSTKLSISPFKEVASTSSVASSVGRRIASKLEKILFRDLSDEIQVVTDISKHQSSAFSGPHYQIEGEVLQAAIETNRSQARRSTNVQTGIDKVETAEYIKWKKRSKGDAPTQYSEKPIMEDIILSMEHIRKLAVVELDYKIISPISQKVLSTNNLSKENNLKGTTTQEFQKGMFLQEHLQADLPSDIKIMDDLATQLSVELGTKLTNYLKGIGKAFYTQSSDSLKRGDKKSSIELLANAVVIKQKKGTTVKKDNTEINESEKKDDQESWIESLKKQVLEFI